MPRGRYVQGWVSRKWVCQDGTNPPIHGAWDTKGYDRQVNGTDPTCLSNEIHYSLR